VKGKPLGDDSARLEVSAAEAVEVQRIEVDRSRNDRRGRLERDQPVGPVGQLQDMPPVGVHDRHLGIPIGRSILALEDREGCEDRLAEIDRVDCRHGIMRRKRP
jgi:hypothetical protein